MVRMIVLTCDFYTRQHFIFKQYNNVCKESVCTD